MPTTKLECPKYFLLASSNVRTHSISIKNMYRFDGGVIMKPDAPEVVSRRDESSVRGNTRVVEVCPVPSSKYEYKYETKMI